MLYVTTRNNKDVYTAHRALINHRGPDGGLYVPFREPQLSREEISAFSEKRFGDRVAEILNLLLGMKLTGWDVDLAIGRYPVRMESMGHRVVMGECWHNLEQDFAQTRNLLVRKLYPEADGRSGSWADISVRIAILFGIFGELMRRGLAGEENPVDISAVSGDFSWPVSAWYARRWGLPIGNIVCACNENDNLWNLLCHGQMKTGDIALPTITPEADIVVPSGLERLIHSCAGAEEVERYLDVVRRGGIYYASDRLLHTMRQGVYVTVTSQHRIMDTISSIYRSYGYILSPCSALTFAGLQDYRARTGESRTALVLTEKSPLRDASVVSNALAISEEALRNFFE